MERLAVLPTRREVGLGFKNLPQRPNNDDLVANIK
jgi:hypothetical protein